jgi:glycosyltransferase involved in cell wall biosynthesis
VTTLVLAGGVLSEARRRGVEHVHAHWATMPALAAYFMRRIEGLPYSLSAHAWDIYAERTLLREKMLAAEFVVTCTAANRETLVELGVPREKVHVSYHGLDFGALPTPRFDRTGPMRLLAVGRLVEQKGFAFLIEAAAELRRRGHALELRIIGEGPVRGALEERLTARGLEDAARLPGQLPQREVFEAYRWASCFVAPSVIASDGDRDGIPNVVLEAMSQGVPVVSTAVSGIPEVVRPGETGWLAPPGDAEALADAIEAAHRDASGALPRAAHALVRREFDVTRNVAVLVTWLSGSLMTASAP